jgi:ABC-2 type transport system permease protein
MSFGRVLGAYLAETGYEVLRLSRAPIFVIPVLLLPVLLFLLFGVVIAGSMDPSMQPAASASSSPWARFGLNMASIMFVSLATMAVVMPALFGVGQTIAIERDQGLLKLKRAQPVPTGAYLIAKVLTQLVFASIAACTIAITALLASRLTFSAAQVWTIVGVLVAGNIPFCAMGLFIGTRASGAAAPGFMHLVFFPMMYLSGMFFPLPPALARWAVVWPTFHVTQLAYAAAGVKQFVFMPPSMSAGVLVGVTVILGGLALRKLARTG